MTIRSHKTMRTLRSAAGFAAALTLVSCGGAQKTSTKEMKEIARGAEPPPANVEPGKQIERKVSQEAKADFAQAVKFFQEQEKAGWTTDRCTAAADKFQEVAGSHSKMVEAYFNAGVAYQRCGDEKNAEGMYKRAISINSSHAPSLANLGEIYFRGGNAPIGKQYFEQAVKADPKITAARNNLAWIIYTQIRTTSDATARGKLEQEALGHLSRVLAVDNDNVVAYTIMALVYMEGAEKNRARLDMSAMLLKYGKERNEKYAPLYNAWGLLYLKKDNVGEGLKMFRRAVELDANLIEARMNVAQLVLSFRKYDEAEQEFRTVANAANVPRATKYDATVGLGVALRGLKRIDEAAKAYEDAIKLAGDRGDAYYNMGLLWKDFRTNDPDPKVNREAYVKAKGYFNQFLGKKDVSDDKRKDAQENIEDCDKLIGILGQAIEAMKNVPAPTPAPAPAPAGGATK